MFGKNLRRRLAGLGVAVALGGGLTAAALAPAASASTAKPASTETCNACFHIQNEYAFRGAVDALHQATAVNSPLGLWYEKSSTTDPGADMLIVPAGTVSHSGGVNQSNLDWSAYRGDQVVRFKYDPNGNNNADTYVGLQGPNPATQLDVALRNDNPNSIWQEWIVVPVTSQGYPSFNGNSSIFTGHYVLVNVGQTVNPDDPYVLTDPGDALTGSLTQLTIQHVDLNQNYQVPTNQVWDTQN